MPQKNVTRERRTLRVTDLGKCYHDRWIFRHVEQEFHGGEPYLLDTPSGSGKTTFFRCLCGLERPEEGEVSGIDVFSVQFQEDRLCEDYSAVKNLEMILGDAKEAREALAQLLPEEALDQPCHELSGGMKRRVSLVRAMEAGAQCVLLDEPFTGLDEENRRKANEYIHTHARGRIIMIATHKTVGGCGRRKSEGRLIMEKNTENTRVTLVGIIVEDSEAAGRINGLLHEYGEYIIGRMGIPYHEKQMNIISVVMDAPQEKVSALSGKLGMIPGVSSKCLYAPDTQKAPK